MTALDDRPVTAPTQTSYTTAQLLLLWDQKRDRSQQTEFGMSELGGCRRRAGYRFAGTEPTNAGSSVQAAAGSAIHKAIETALHAMQDAGLIPAEDLIETEVWFAGIKGHFDRYESVTGTVVDTKTTSSRWLETIKRDGPTKQNRWQINGYGAALISMGYKVRRVRIEFLARDTGEEYTWESPFDPAAVREAMAWVRGIRATPIEMLSRDYAPDSTFCKNCPFHDRCWDGAVTDRDVRSVLFVDDPDAAKWAQRLDEARHDKADAERRETEAKGALDALRPNEAGTSDPVDVGYEKDLLWTVKRSERLDTAAVRHEYEEVGAKPPTKVTTSVELKLVAKPEAAAA